MVTRAMIRRPRLVLGCGVSLWTGTARYPISSADEGSDGCLTPEIGTVEDGDILCICASLRLSGVHGSHLVLA